MNIRHADPARDAAGCAAIYGPFVRDTAASFEVNPPSAEEFAERIKKISQTHPWLVAEEDGQLVGFAYGCPHRERAAYRWAAEVTVYVHPAHHRKRIAATLYQELFNLLRAQGIHTLCAGVTLPNPASVSFHESLGFQPIGVYRKIGYKLGRWHDVGWWQLFLRDPTRDPPEEPIAPAKPPKHTESLKGAFTPRSA
jgi:L-amino acid N-acyltransferase YncA